MTELNPDALKIAESLDQERNEGKLRGYVHVSATWLYVNTLSLDRYMVCLLLSKEALARQKS